MVIQKNIKGANRQCGQSTLEFAMVIPIVLILVLAASQVGFMVYTRMLMQQASREAARVITTTNSNELAVKTVKDICGDDARITIDPGPGSGRSLGDMVTVRVFKEPAGFLKIIDQITGKQVILDSRASMRMECDRDDG